MSFWEWFLFGLIMVQSVTVLLQSKRIDWQAGRLDMYVNMTGDMLTAMKIQGQRVESLERWSAGGLSDAEVREEMASRDA